MKTDIFVVLRQFINTASSLEDEEKNRYLGIIDKLVKGEPVDVEATEELNLFLDDEMTALEDAAILAHDSDLITKMASLRNSRLEMEKLMLGIAENPAHTSSN